MPLFLFWYILRDLLKMLVLSTAVLVTIISFGAAIKPLTDGALGPLSLLKFILLAMPPMLQFALPFAAAFSATMVYHRMTSDNEIAACAAGGVSYPQVLLPAATLGVLLTISLSLIANYVSPRFWEAMRLASHLDAAEHVMRTIERGEAVQTRDTLLFARQARRIDPPPDSGAHSALWLDGLLAVTFRDGEMVSTHTADESVVYILREGSETIIAPIVAGARVFDMTPGRGQVRLLLGEAHAPEFIIEDEFRASPRFFDLNRLKEVLDEPQTYPRVAVRVEELNRHLAKRHLFRTLDADLRRGGRADFTMTTIGRGEQVVRAQAVLYAGGLEETGRETWLVGPLRGEEKVRLVAYQDGRPLKEIRAREMRLHVEMGRRLEEPLLIPRFTDATILDLLGPRPQETRREALSGEALRPDPGILSRLGDRPLHEALNEARAQDDPDTTRLERAVVDEIVRLHRHVRSRLHERTAMSVSCLVMMLLGATLAMLLRASLPLTVYAWSFIPAILGLVLISAGADFVKGFGKAGEGDAIGVAVMWSGNLIMAVLALTFLRRVMKN